MKSVETTHICRRLKVLYVLPNLDYGGTTRVAMSFASRAARDGFSVKIVVLRGGAFLERVPPGVEVIRLIEGNNVAQMAAILKGASLAIKLAHLFKKECPDVVISDVTWLSILVILCKLFFGARFSLLVRVGNLKSRGLRKRRIIGTLERLSIRYLIPRADRIIVPSNAVKEDLMKYFAIPQEKITFIPNPVEIEAIQLKSSEPPVNYPHQIAGEPVFVSVSRLSERKGVRYLIEAFSVISNQIKAYLLIIGDGPQRKELEELVIRLGLSSRVRFLGYIPDPFNYVKRATAYIHPALWDGFGYAVVEAMACGTPPIVLANSGGPAEIVEDGKNGLVVEPTNVSQLANAMLRLAKDAELRARLAEGALQTVRRYAAEEVIHSYERLIIECAQ
jgi:glycosyltransferase involved in cell wall biosynthesis